MSNDLFTPAGREYVRALFSKENELLVCEHGFLDHAEGIPVDDEGMLNIMMRRHADMIDRAEIAIGLSTGKYLFCGRDMSAILFAEGSIGGNIFDELRSARIKAGRPLMNRQVTEAPVPATELT